MSIFKFIKDTFKDDAEREGRIFTIEGDDAETLARLIDEKNRQYNELGRPHYESHLRLWRFIERLVPAVREGDWKYKLDGIRILIIEVL